MGDRRGATLTVFRMFKYHFDDLLSQITSYIQQQNTHSNPIGVLLRLAVALRILASGSSQQCIVPVTPHSHSFCEPIFFPYSASRALFHLRSMVKTVGPGNHIQNVRQIKMTSATLHVLPGAKHCQMAHSCVFFT